MGWRKVLVLTYQLPDSIREIAMQGEFDEFDLLDIQKQYENRLVSPPKAKTTRGIRGNIPGTSI